MHTTEDFLTRVLPTAGPYYCVVGRSPEGRTFQSFSPSIRGVTNTIKEHTERGNEVFFALSTYKEPGNRRYSNLQATRSLYVDLDCGDKKPYATQRDALSALKKFVTGTGLPAPTVVNSGGGIHAYWTAERNLSLDEWRRMSARVRELAREHGLEIDAEVTLDACRILRVPGTLNLKQGKERPATLLRLAESLPTPELLGVLKPKPNPLALLDPVQAARAAKIVGRAGAVLTLSGNFKSSFRTILKRSAEGTGCAQMLYAYNEQATLEEPLWRAALSIANVCEDRDKAIGVMSSKYPGYSWAEADAKASATAGPYTCDTYRALNPETCEGCPHNITSPILLGKALVEAKVTEDGNYAEDEEELETDEELDEELVEEDEEGIIPIYPAPFARGRHGGVYIKVKTEDGDDVQLVYPYDLYVVRRINDPDMGEMLLVRLHLPQDGIREFMLGLSTVLAKDKLRDALGAQGVTAMGKRQELLMVYLTRWVEELQTREQAQLARKQFGWTEDKEGFVIGDREIRGDDEVYSPPSNVTLPIVPSFEPRGKLEVWRRVVSHYANPGLEGKAFAIFLGFGNMLLDMTEVQGYWLSLYSPQSGAGKTTTLRAVASIYGDPRRTMMRETDTDNMFWNRVGVYNHIPVMLDEISNMAPERSSHRVYGITEGRGKGRLQAHANVERLNHSHWCTGIISSSNDSLRDKLMRMKLMPEGELMRVLEYRVLSDPHMSSKDAGPFFEQLNDNYGLAAAPFIQFVINNLGDVKRMVSVEQTRLYDELRISGPERFWASMGAIAMVGGRIANKLGLIEIPTKPVREFFKGMVETARSHSQAMRREATDFLGTMLQAKIREILVVNGGKDASHTVLGNVALREPLAGLSIRYEPDTKMLYVSAPEYKKECAKSLFSYDGSLEPYMESGAYKGTRRMRMAAGSVYDTGVRTQVLEFDTTKLPYFDEEALLDAEAAGGDV